MYKTIVLALALLTSAVWLQAQAMSQSGSDSNSATVQGCLQNAAGRYSLKADDGTIYHLTGAANKLKAHVGHEVAITGTPTTRTKSTTQEGAASTAHQEPVLKVTDIKHIAATCSSGAASQ